MSDNGQGAQPQLGATGSPTSPAPNPYPQGYGDPGQQYPGQQYPGQPYSYQQPAGYPPAAGYGYGAPGPWAGQKQPSSNIGWAVGALLLFWPLCIPAFIASTRVSDLWFAGRYQESLQASADAKRWGRLGVIIGAGLTGLMVLFYIGAFFSMAAGSAATFSL